MNRVGVAVPARAQSSLRMLVGIVLVVSVQMVAFHEVVPRMASSVAKIEGSDSTGSVSWMEAAWMTLVLVGILLWLVGPVFAGMMLWGVWGELAGLAVTCAGFALVWGLTS